MIDMIWAILLVGAGGALTHAWHVFARTKREGADIAAVAVALKFGVVENMLDLDDAQKIYRFWWEIYKDDTEPVPCACGVIGLHCDDDEAVFKGILHTTKYCDVAPEEE